jgi:hypothetical protein
MSDKPHCENCTAWELWKGYMGYCKALPPIALGRNTMPTGPMHADWPQTRDGDWCRDGFRSKE